MSGNGCGPSWMPRWIKSALFDWFFEASCARHDEGYEEGGTEARRKVCDDKFLEAMRMDTLRYRGAQRLLRWSQAYVFYAMVRVFGWMTFKYKSN